MRMVKYAALLFLSLAASSVLADVSVVSTYPANGSNGVDPGTDYVRIRFSGPVDPESYSFTDSNQGAHVDTTGKPTFDEGNKLCLMPVILEPGTVYAIRVNGEAGKGFRSAADGTPVKPYLLKFTTSGTAGEVKSRVTKWQEDLDFLASELPKRHKNLFFHLTEHDWNAKLQKIREDIPALSDADIMVRLKSLIDSVGDPHSGIDVFESSKLSRLPVGFYSFADGVFVVGASDEYKSLLGCRLVKVGNQDVKKAWSAISDLYCFGNESDQQSRVPRYFSEPDLLKGASLIKSPDSVPLALEDKDGNTIKRTVKSVPHKTQLKKTMVTDSQLIVPMYRLHRDLPFWVCYLATGNLVYFQYNECVDPPHNPFNGLCSDLADLINAHQSARLVIDLRLNGGGDSGVLDPLIDHIKSTDFGNQKGKLFVITGRETYGSAVFNAARLRYETNAIFVGEEPGMSCNTYGEQKTFELPNSDLRITYSIRYFRFSKDASGLIKPDIVVKTKFSEYASGIDPVLNAIINLN